MSPSKVLVGQVMVVLGPRSRGWSPPTCAWRCIPARRSSRPSCPRPVSGSRGLLPPVTPTPVFAIRKRAVLVYTLDRYVEDGVLTAKQAIYLRQAVRDSPTFLIACE